MDKKLTLSLNKSVIERAKAYAKSRNTSLSRIIEAYLSAITRNEKTDDETTPLVESLIGIISLEGEQDLKKSYSDYLSDKYK